MNLQASRSWLAVLLLLVAGTAVAAEESTAWRQTLERISSGVVSIRVDGTRAFDTDWNQSSQATGFIVDRARGLVLTNRHVVMPGPVVAEAVFLNREEVELRPVYRDPVHDFGIFRFDPSALRFIDPTELDLRPGLAAVGREIRVVGNDAGEQLSILAGTIARLDRQAPSYGRGKYNDFNTFYYQAASGTSGGSSGSPVIDVAGNVIALNAGANSNAASSFFLPLDRIARALRLIQANQPVTRGTLQTVFTHRPYDELRRLGLNAGTEAQVRKAFASGIGMLVVNQVVPGGPADDLLQPGDILVRLNGALITEFVPLETVLDDGVGSTVTLGIERGGKPQELELVVQDLHAITPATYLDVSDAVLHRLSYQQARHFNMKPEGIYVANPGYMLSASAIPRGAVITSVDGAATPDLDALQAVLEGLADGDRAVVRYHTFADPNSSTVRGIRMDRRWFPASRCWRDDVRGFWPCTALADAGKPPDEPVAGSTRFAVNGDHRTGKVAPSLVLVNFDMPYTVSGVSDRHYHGTGLVVDAARGMVVVDRNTVPVAIGDVSLTFAGSLEIPGRVEFIHPLHNLAMVTYDPALIGDTPVRSAQFSTREVEPGDALWVVGLRGDHKLVSQATEVASVDAATFPLSRTFRFRDTNLETVSVVNAPGGIDGVLADKSGRIVSLWSSFAFQGGSELEQINMGVPAELVQEMIALVREGKAVRSLETEFFQLPLASARKLGLPNDWVRRMEDHNPKRRQILQVVRTVAGSPAAGALTPGDLVLTVDGHPVNTFREVERTVQDRPAVDATVWRDGAMTEIRIGTVALDGRGIDRIMLWAGALLQEPHRALAAQRGIPPEGVYVAYFGYGSPATRYGLWAGRRIVEVDGRPVDGLESFKALVAGRGDRESVRLKTVGWNGETEVITLKLDLQYWPAYELWLDDAGSWERRFLDAALPLNADIAR